MNSGARALQPLPIAARPRAGEGVESYIQRLARANHLRPSYLRRLLLHNPYALYGGSVDLERLAVVANRHPDTLQRVLQPSLASCATARSKSPRARRPRKQADRPELFAAIREFALRDELSIRALAELFAVHRRTVRQALADPTPPPRKTHEYPAPRLDPARALIDAMLTADPTMAAGHVWERLLDEHNVIASYSTVRKYLSEQRPRSRPSQRARPATLSR
jgi:hypothetical protein